MKYLLLLALTTTVIAASLTGCSYDQTHSHDIYRAQYDYKPLPQQDASAPAAKSAPQVAPPSEDNN